MTPPVSPTAVDRTGQFNSGITLPPDTPLPKIKGSFRSRLYRTWVENYTYVSNVARVIGLVATVKTSVFLNFAYRALATTSLTWNQHVWVVKAAKNIKLLSVVSLPFALYSVMSSSWKIISGKEKIDSALNAIEGLSWLGDSSSTFIAGLDVIGLLKGTAKLTSTLSFLSVMLASATIFINMRRVRQGRAAIQEIEAVVGHGESNAAAAIKMMAEKDSYYLEKNFGVSPRKLQRVLTNIYNSAKEHNQEINKEQSLINAVDCLKKRIKTKKLSHQLTIVSTAITLIGMTIILLSPPLAVAAYCLLTVAGSIATFNFLYERRVLRLFQNHIQRI